MNNDILKNYLKNGYWVEKESMHSFLESSCAEIQNYIESFDLNYEENLRYNFLKKSLPLSSTFTKSDTNEFLKFLPEFKYRVECNNSRIVWPKLKSDIKEEKIISKGKISSLDSEQLAFYRKFGVIGPIQLTSLMPGQLDNLCKISLKEKRSNKENESVHIVSKNILELASNEGILSKISSILGNNIILLMGLIHVIPPHQNPGKSFLSHSIPHSDFGLVEDRFEPGFFEENGGDAGFLNVWISLTGTNEDHAPLNFFPTTHHWGLIPISEYLKCASKDTSKIDYFFRAMSFIGNKHIIARMALNCEVLLRHSDPELHSIRRTQIYAEPGGIIIFNGHTLHNISLNRTNSPRIAVSFRYRNALEKPLTPINFGLTNERLSSLYTEEELKEINFSKTQKTPAIQILGNKCHQDYQTININRLLDIMDNRGYQ